ncbi:MAG: FAD:protein FMN transferase [Myxococcota bacterium]
MIRRAFRAMGSPCEVRLHPQRKIDAGAIADAAVAEIRRLEQKYSRYREDSLATRINRSAGTPSGVEVDSETAALLDYAATAHAQSDGLFDPTSGILRRAWSRETTRLPTSEELASLLEHVGWQRLRWQPPQLLLPAGMELDFGGFVKEYAADRAAELCRRLGARHGLIDLGGDLAVVGRHPDGSPWRVGIRNPRAPESAVATVDLFAGGIATSGDYERFVVLEGKRYSHLLDPRTGWPVEGLAGVSVAAPHCLVAGSATTIAMLKGADGAPWLEELGLPHLTVAPDGTLAGPLARPGSASLRGHGDELAGEALVAGA